MESQLRCREQELAEVRDELSKAAAYNEALQRQVQELGQSHAAKPLIEHIAPTAGIKEVVLGRQTGGYDDDKCPGDEALQVVLEPRDCDGHAIKVPGALRVAVLEIDCQGLKKPLSWWELPPDQLRRTWKSGLLSTGYYVILPWKTWPTTEKLRVVAQFTLTDGRLFEADKDVTIKLPPEQFRKSIVPTPAPPPPEALPLPRKTEGPELTPTHYQAKKADAAKTVPLSDAVHLLRPRASD